MNQHLVLPAPAKLNLFLHITGRRADGYHDLQTLFQLLDWGDTLDLRAAAAGTLTLECDGQPLDSAEQDNLVMRAARLLQPQDRGAHIRLHKRIPAGGGLGGGSSDAATTLLGLNRLWQLGLTAAELQRLGAGLGADVPVFVAGRSAWAEGVGERLTAVSLPESWYLVITPDCHVSTAEIFSHQQLTRNTSPIKIAAFFEGHSRNDCQQLVRRLHREVDNTLNWLENFGEARMTGTGASVFARFASEAAARAVYDQLPPHWQGFVARGVNESPLLAALG